MNKQISVLGLILFSSVVSANLASASLNETSIRTTCSYLISTQMMTGGWTHYYSSEYGCSSPYKQFGTGFPLKNNIAYYVEGDEKNAKRLKLVLNVNNKAEAKSAHDEMLKAATLLMQKSIAMELPKIIQDAIKKGHKAVVNIGDTKVKIIRDDWPTGKGYELQLYIE